MNKILVVDESSLFRKFVMSLLGYSGYKVFTARSAFDGLNQMRKIRPNLVIMDDDLNRQSVNSFLKKKNEDVNIKDIPVVFIAKNFSQERIVQLCKVKVRRFLVKPLKIDHFLTTVSSFFGKGIDIDQTECQLHVHVNENLILVEIARGFNRTKLSLVQWKIKELLIVNSINNPKIMLLMSDVVVDDENKNILDDLLKSLIAIPRSIEDVKILTSDKYVKDSIICNPGFEGLDICNNLIEAIDAFFGKKGLEKLTSNQDMVHEFYLATQEEFETSGMIDLSFKEDHNITQV